MDIKDLPPRYQEQVKRKLADLDKGKSNRQGNTLQHDKSVREVKSDTFSAKTDGGVESLFQKNKYGNEIITSEGIKFDSKKEKARYDELLLLEKAGEIRDLKRQVEFLLIPKQYDDNGKLIERAVRYYADFVYYENDKIVVEDVKSKATKTPVYILKRKLLLKEYGIRIREI